MQLQQFLPSFKRPVMLGMADPSDIIAAQSRFTPDSRLPDAQDPPPLLAPAHAASWFDSSFDLRAGLEVKEWQLDRF